MLRFALCPARAFAVIVLVGGCAIDGRTVGVGGQAGSPSTAGVAGSLGSYPAGSGGSNPGAGGAGDSHMPSNVAGADGVAGSTGMAGQGGDGGSTPDGGIDEPPLPSCAAQALSGLGSATATTTAAGTGTFSLSCGTGSSDDVGIHWVAPAAGYYSIDTFGSDFDTVLGVVPASCDGTELACNDNAGEPPQSELVREFAAGESVVFVIDGKSGGFGNAVLNAHAVTCPAIDTARQQLPLSSSTLAGTNEHGGACGGDGQPEQTFRWQAPASGLFRFTASADGMTPALYVERGARCGAELLGCNTGGFSGPAVVVRHLNEGEVVTLIVEGTDGAGDFQLNVEDVSENVCPDQPELIPFDVPEQSGTLVAGDPSVLTGSCVPERQRILPGGDFALPDHAYALTVEGAFCTLFIAADGPVAVYVLEGSSCGGAELSCETFESPDFERAGPSLGDLEGPAQSFVVVVESSSPVTNNISYTLDLSCAIP